MKLDGWEIGTVYYYLAEYRRRGLPTGSAFNALYGRLHRVATVGEVSPTRQQSGTDSSGLEHVELVGARLAADILGWHGPAGLRRVQRHAADLGGWKVGNRLIFRADTVKQYRDTIEGGAQ